jgi:C-terminal processing protease CtpA/Prc
VGTKYAKEILGMVLVINVWACSSNRVPGNIVSGDHQYKIFCFEVQGEQETSAIGKELLKAIKDKLIQKGYIYKQTAEVADLKVVIRYEVNPTKSHYLKLSAKLDTYAAATSKKLYSSSASKSVLQEDIAANLIQPIARQLTVKFPYAAGLGGIGVLVGGDLKIKGFSPNSPARDAGLQLFDHIVAVDGKEVNKPAECQELLKGKVDTPVKLHVIRGTQELDFVINRISLNEMNKKSFVVDKEARKNLLRDFRKRVLEQP